MKIKDIKTQIFKAPLKKPFVTSLRRVDMLEDVIVTIECYDGTLGFGEGASTPIITGETIGSIIATVEYIRPFLLGREIEDFDSIIYIVHSVIIGNTTAKSAIEIALYDLKAKSTKLPLYKMLGGERRDFSTDITISMGEVDDMVSSALGAISLGYDRLKIKIGDNIAKDIDRIIAIDEAIDKSIKLRLDANQGWSAKESVKLLHTLEARGVVAEFIEQPVRADDIDGLLYIKQRVQTPLLADESIFSLTQAQRLLELEAIDYINIKLAKSGGITNSIKLANLSREFGVKCMIGCMLEGVVALSAGVHVASACADVITMIDLDAVSLLESYDVDTDIVFDESRIILSDSVGLGCRVR